LALINGVFFSFVAKPMGSNFPLVFAIGFLYSIPPQGNAVRWREGVELYVQTVKRNSNTTLE
jgi:hypothetical protein